MSYFPNPNILLKITIGLRENRRRYEMCII